MIFAIFSYKYGEDLLSDQSQISKRRQILSKQLILSAQKKKKLALQTEQENVLKTALCGKKII